MSRALPYEQKLDANPITRFLHSGRHVLAAKKVASLQTRSRVVDIGCATAMLFPQLPEGTHYLGIEPRADFAAAAQERYADNSDFSIFEGLIQDALPLIGGADYILALECFEHIPRADLLDLLPRLAGAIACPMLVTVPVEVGPILWGKNLGSFAMRYVRHREYSWAETFWAGLGRLDRVPPHTSHHKGFDWRQLIVDLSQHFDVAKVTGMPLGMLPAGWNPSVAIEVAPRLSG